MLAPHAHGPRLWALASALLSLRFDMHLTRVSGASAHETSQAVATGSAGGDVLALLLGGAGEASPAFPLTLEAALANGDPSADPLAEASDETRTDSGDAAALSIEAALAAALALGAAVAAEPAAAPTEGGDAAAADATAVGAMITASAAVAEDAATVAVAPAVDADAAVTKTGESAAQAAAAVDAVATAADASADRQAKTTDAAARPTPAAETSATDTAAAGTARTAVGGADHEHAPRTTAKTDPAADDPAPAREVADLATHGHAGDDADAAPSFEHRDDGESTHGDPARATAAASIETTAKLTLTVTAPGAVGDTTHATRADAIDPATTSAVQTTSTGTGTTATHANAPARAEHTPLAHGTIEARWSERVTDAVRLSALRGGGEIRLQLEPEGLGHIDVRLDLHADGVRAVIVAEHESTRALLQSQQQTLHDAFGRSDLRLSGFSVDVGSGGAAAFQRGSDGGEGGQAPASAPSLPSTTTTSTDAADAATTPAGNGRVNVRV